MTMAMAPQHILAESAESGVQVTVEGDRLRVKAREGRIPPALLDRIRANKVGLLDLLRGLPVSLHQLINDIALGDALDVLKQIPDNSIDLIATDPPYGLGFMGKKWDQVLPDPRIIRELFRVLKPGAFAFIMAAPRQDVLSRMILALEDAGFVTGFSSLYWTYASGFPKAHNTSKAVDRRFGADRVVVCERIMPDMRGGNFGQGQRRYTCTTVQDTLPATADAERLDGAYGGFQPKPAVEVILVVMKPLDAKNYTAQAMKDGKGVTWLDDCRIPYGEEVPSVGNRHHHDLVDGYGFKPPWQIKGGVKWTPEKEWKQDIERQAHEKGRFPANLVVSDGVLDDGRSHKSSPMDCIAKNEGGVCYGKFFPHRAYNPGDSGGYSRFFSLDAWSDLNIGDLPGVVQRNLPYLIVPKASKREKDAGLETNAEAPIKGRDAGQDSRNVPQKARPSGRRNIHPTVKPIQLMAYLITMGSREGDIVLDPFAGSGSGLIAAQMLKRRFIGIELDPEYHEIAVRRLAHHAKSITGSED